MRSNRLSSSVHGFMVALTLVAAPRAVAQATTDQKPNPVKNGAPAEKPRAPAPVVAKPAANPAGAKPAPPTPAAAKPTAAPAAAAKKARKKAPPATAAAEPEKPKDLPPATETTLIEPSFLYRAAKLWPRSGSVFHKPDHGDFFDQYYLTLRFQKTFDYLHTVVVEPAFRTKRENPATWDTAHVIDQAYVESAVTDKLDFTVGKKTEYEGSGFIVSPSDLLNEDKDLLDQIYQREGVSFTRLRYRLPADLRLGLGFIPIASQPTVHGRALLQLSGELKEVEIRLNVTEHETQKTTTGLSLQRFFGERFELHYDARYQARQRDPEAVGNGYLAFSPYVHPGKPSDPSGYYLGGTRLVLTPRRTLVLEAIEQQSGLLPADFTRYFSALRAKKDLGSDIGYPATRLQGRQYAFASLQDDDTLPATHMSASYLLNVDDGSAFIVGSVRHALSKLTSVELSPTFFRGRPATEFGEMPFAQGYYIIFRGKF